MKTAVLISGHMRTFDRCLPTQAWHLLRHFDSPHFYVSTVADADTPKADLLRHRYPHARVEIDVAPEQPVIPLPSGCPPEEDWQPGAIFTHEPYAISVPPQAVLRQLWQLHRCWQFFAGSAHPADYDLIIRLRPDLWFHSFEMPAVPRQKIVHFQSLAGIGEFRPQDTPWAFTPWWGRFGGVNDRLALLHPAAAYAYFTTHERVPRLLESGCPLHPESLFAASLDQSCVDVRPVLRAEFSTLKQTPEGPRFRAPEISLIDLAHATA